MTTRIASGRSFFETAPRQADLFPTHHPARPDRVTFTLALPLGPITPHDHFTNPIDRGAKLDCSLDPHYPFNRVYPVYIHPNSTMQHSDDAMVSPSPSPSAQAPTPTQGSAPRRPPRKSTLTQQQRNQKRQRATQDQLVTLEVEFNKNPTPTAATRERIASDINMTERSVQIWFQNRCAL